MNSQHEQVINVLNRLVEICEDGNRGYKDASDHLEHGDVKTILYRLSQQRALFEAELKNEVRNLGGNPDVVKEDNSGTVLGNLHKAFLNIKEKFSKHDYEAVIEECKRGDKAAVLTYEEALKENLPDYIKEMVANQHHLIKGALIQLEEFKVNPS